MDRFNLSGAPVSRAATLTRLLPLSGARDVRTLALVCAFAALAGWLGGVAAWQWFILALMVAYVAALYVRFIDSYLARVAPQEPTERNLACYLDFEAAQLFLNADGTDASVLLVPMMRIRGMAFVLERLGISPRDFRAELRAAGLFGGHGRVAEADALSLVRACVDDLSQAKRPLLVGWRELFLALSERSSFLSPLMQSKDMTKEDVRLLLDWQAHGDWHRDKRVRFWSRESLLKTPALGRGWAAGYTPHLAEFALDLTQAALSQGFEPELYGRVEETEQMERILARDGQNNVLLVGEPGVGKSLAVRSLAYRIARGDTLPDIAHHRVFELDLGILKSGADTQEIERRLELILGEAARAGDVILAVESIDALFDDSGAPGTVDAAHLLLPFLELSGFRVVGLTTFEDYHRTLAKNPALLRTFDRIEMREPEKEDVYAIMRDVAPALESHNGVFILYQAVKAAIELSDRYVKTVPYPEKAIDLLQEAAVYAKSQRHSSAVLQSDVEEVVHRKTQIPVGKVSGDEGATLLKLENDLHRRVVGQDEAISVIANALRRARAGMTGGKRPIGSFLFLGPTGVGKTETARALADVYFGSSDRMIRFDMSEFQQSDSVSRLIGHDEEGGVLTKAITDNPFSLVLLDELEKASPDILNLFLQVLEDGRLTDALGRTVDFTNAIIIATSNAGAEQIREAVANRTEEGLKERLMETLQQQGMFRPEFLNRFDAVVLFKPLADNETLEVARLMLGDLNERLKDKGITVAATDEALAKLASLADDRQYGARALRRVMQDDVENLIAKKMLSGELPRGSTYTLSPEEL